MLLDASALLSEQQLTSWLPQDPQKNLSGLNTTSMIGGGSACGRFLAAGRPTNWRLFPIPFAILHEEPRDSIVKINQLVIYASNFQLVTILEPFCDLARGIIKDL